MDVQTLLTRAVDLPGAEDIGPGSLGQMIAAVAHAYAGKKIGHTKVDLDTRMARLQAMVDALDPPKPVEVEIPAVVEPDVETEAVWSATLHEIGLLTVEKRQNSDTESVNPLTDEPV